MLSICKWLLFLFIIGWAETSRAQPENSQIAFLSNRDGIDEVYVMNVDGSNQQNLSQNPLSRDIPSAWSPDGSRIAFVSERDGNFEVYVMDNDGMNQENLTQDANVDNAPYWSPDGGKIYFDTDRSGNGEIYVMDLEDSNDPHAVTNWSNYPGALDGSGVPSPDGNRVAFMSRRDTEPKWEIYVADVDGSNLRRLTHNLVDDYDPAWSPDGMKIAYRSTIDGNEEIYVMDADLGDVSRVNLTNNPASDAVPSWSPDGEWIAFRSNRSGNHEIYIMDKDGNNVKNLSQNGALESNPFWSPFLPPEVLVVAIDIKPGSSDNPINLKSNGVIPVAILSTDGFDARTVDGRTVEFAGTGPVHGGHIEDVDGDGDGDWVGHFNVRDSNILPGDTGAALTGQTTGGNAIAGNDAIEITKGSGKGKAKRVTGTAAKSWAEIKDAIK